MKQILTLLAAILLILGIAAGQENRSTIQGTVRDPQSAVVANATVNIVNTATNTRVSVKTNDTGHYLAPLLLPGNYTVTAEATGFKKQVNSGINLLSAEVRTVDLTIQVGASTESVTVTAEAPLVDVSHTDSGMALDDRTVRDLPVMSNVVTSMIQFAPGVNSGFSASQLLGPHSTQGGSDYNNGSGVGGNVWTIDGAFSNGNGRNTSLLPSVSSVSEVKVLDNTFDGSFGHTVGLGISVTTKSGTNDFHGDASENYWSQRWQGSNLFTKQSYYKNINSLLAAGNSAGVTAAEAQPIQPSGHSNMYGFTATGPLRIPKIIDMRNKVFWTLSYNGERDAKPETANSYGHVVPSAAEKSGNFTDLLKVTSDGLNYNLFDPFSVKVDSSRTGTHYIRTPLPGNVLPPSYAAMGNNVYKNYTKYWPDPNNWFDGTQAQNAGCPNVSSNCGNADFMGVTTPYNWNFGQWSGRMDINVTDKLRLFGRYTRNHFEEYRSDWTYFIVKGYNNSGANGTGVTRDDQNGVLDAVYSVSPSTMMHGLVSVSNWMSYTTTLPYASQFKPSDAGLPTYLDANCGNWCYLPQMNISGYSTNGISGTPGPQYNRFYDANYDVYYNRGNHQFRVGADFRQQTRSIHNGNNDGSYTFGNNYFRQFDDAGPNGNYNAGTLGLSWASFMTGLPTSNTISNSSSYIASNQYAAAFAQDTWRVTPRFTLTLSLRGEWENGAKGKHDYYIVGWDPTAQLPITSAAQAAYAANPVPELAGSSFSATGGAQYAGTSGAPDRAWKSELVWLPRIGFGYQIDRKTVIRGGYGLYYDTLDVNAQVTALNQTGYAVNTGTTFTTTNGVSWGQSGACGAWCTLSGTNMVSPLTDPFPVRPSNGSTRFNVPVYNQYGSMGLLALANGPSSWTVPPEKHPRMQRWRLGIERQVTEHDLISIGYTGAWTDRLNVNENASALPSKFWYFGNSRPVNNTSGTLVTPGGSIAVGGTIPCAAGNLNPNNPGSAYGGYGCLEDTNLGSQVTNGNPFYINNFAALQSSNPALYAAMTTAGSFFTSNNITKSTLLRAYPSSNLTLPAPVGRESETEIDASLNHRFSRGLVGSLSYTYFHSNLANSFFNSWNPLDTDHPQTVFWQPNNIQPQRVTATWVYDLPFGKGRHFLSSGKLLDTVVGGWTVSGNYVWSQGTLLQLPNAFFYGDINSIKLDQTSVSQWFSTAGCVLPGQSLGPGDVAVPLGQPCNQGWEKRTALQPGTYQARNTPLYVGDVRNPNAGQLNGSIGRDFKFAIKDHPVSFQVRGDVLNVMNHSFMGGINTGVTSGVGTFGAITSGSTVLNRFIQIQGHIRW